MPSLTATEPPFGTAAKEKPRSLDALTGLRFIAAITVVLFHASKFANGSTSLGPWAANAVTFFFVLSGFILTYVYHNRLKHIGPLKFYLARLARIWPLHIFCLLAALWAKGYIFGDRSLNFDLKLVAHIGLFQSWFPIQLQPFHFNSPAWSISTELAFYLLFPLLLLLEKTRYLLILIFSIMLVVVALDVARENGLIEFQLGRSFVYAHPLIRLADFVAGIITAKMFLRFHPRSKRLPTPSVGVRSLHTVFEIIAVGCTIATIYVANSYSVTLFLVEHHLRLGFVWLSLGGACLIPFCATIWFFSWSQGWFSWLMSTRLLVYLGEISFALYLIQLPVFLLLNQQVEDSNWPASLYLTVSVACTLGAAMFAHAVVEAPLRQFFTSRLNGGGNGLHGFWTQGLRNLHRFRTRQIAGLPLLFCFKNGSPAPLSTVTEPSISTSAKVTKQKPRSLDALTGLRFIAAITVVLVHALKFAQGSTSLGPWASNAVTFFFVLSGFILTYVYHDRLIQTGLLKFYWARFARIWPLHIVCLAATLWMNGYIFGHRTLNFDLNIAAHVGLVQSWPPADQLPMMFNGPAWSISTEFGFYLLFPTLLLLGKKRFLPILLASAILIPAIVVAMDFAHNRDALSLSRGRVFVYMNPSIRVLEFIAGMFTAKMFLGSRLSNSSEQTQTTLTNGLHTLAEIAAWALTLTIIWWVNYSSFPAYMTNEHLLITFAWLSRGGACVIGFSAVIWVFSWSQGVFAKLASLPLMVYLGEISFAVYLIQLPVFYLLNKQVKDQHWPASLYLIVSVASIIAAAMIAHALVEKPSRQLLTSLYDRDWKSSRDSLTQGFVNLRKHHTGLLAGLILLLSYGVVKFETNNVSRYDASSQVQPSHVLDLIDDVVDVDFEPITFKEEATLRWLKVEDQGDQVLITMWWELLEGHQRARIMHFSDAEGNMLAARHRNDRDFIGKPAGSLVLETCLINKDEFVPSMKYIGVGFWTKGLPLAPADRGQTQMNHCRLLIAELTEDAVVGIDETTVRFDERSDDR